MEVSRKPRLEWIDSPFRELLRLSWPIAVSTLSYSVMTLVDTLFVARIGPAALAGVGLGGVIAFTLLCFPIGLLRGVKVLVSQAVGAGEDSGNYLMAGLVLGLGFALVTVTGGLLLAPLLGAFTSAEVAGHASTYLAIRCLGSPLVFVYVALRESRYGQGDARTPMAASLAANTVNVGLDYLLIVVMGMGVSGAAWASVAANGVEALVMVIAQSRAGWRSLAGLGGYIAQVWRMGIPTGIQFLLEVGSFTLLTGMIAAMSEVEMAAHQIVIQVIHFSFLPACALAEAGSVLVGQAVGGQRDELVGVVARLAMAVAAVYTGVCSLVFALGGGAIARLFSSDAELVATAITLLQVAAVFQIADGANVVARGILRGTGDVRYPAVVGIITAWLFTPPLTWLLGYHLGWGALGGWIGLSAEIFVGAGLFWWRLGRGGWRVAATSSRERMVRDPVPAALVATAES
jgi:MATE family multidrug resistance protein